MNKGIKLGCPYLDECLVQTMVVVWCHNYINKAIQSCLINQLDHAFYTLRMLATQKIKYYLSNNSNLESLHLISFGQGENNWILQEDNDPKHLSAKAQRWKIDNQIK